MDKPKDGPFHWCKPETARELARRIDAAGASLVRLEIRVDRSRDGEPMTFRVVTRDDATGTLRVATEADLNDTWTCPIFCPDD